MKRSIKRGLTFMSIGLLMASHYTFAEQSPNAEVVLIGAMKDVMWKGEVEGKIQLRTLADKGPVYGMGPLAHMTGELLIIGGKSYKSTVLTDTAMKVEETYDVSAPFFGYAVIEKWRKHPLPDEVQTIQQLERHLDQLTKSKQRPFLFTLKGNVDTAEIHVLNLPAGTKVTSPKDAHKGKVFYSLQNEPVEIVGFFSTEHQGIFTHHDTFLHMHLITADRQKMGHLDQITLQAGAELYLPDL